MPGEKGFALEASVMSRANNPVPWAAAKRILFLRHHGLGDLVNALPALENLRLNFPNSEMAVTLKTIDFAWVAHPARVDHLFVYNSSLTGSFGPRKGVTNELAKTAKFLLGLRRWRPDLVIGTHYMSDRLVLLCARAAGARWVIGECSHPGYARFFSRYSAPASGRHACDANLAILGLAGIPVVVKTPKLAIDSADAEAVWAGLSKNPGCSFAAFHVSAGEGRNNKIWAPSKFAAVAQYLYRNWNLCPCFVGGPADASATEAVLRQLEVPYVNAIGATNVRETALLLSKVKVVIGNDSGVMHLAGAVGAQGVAIFGPTDPRVWRPVGGQIRVIYSALPCSPCSGYLKYGCGNNECMNGDSLQATLAAVQQILGGQ